MLRLSIVLAAALSLAGDALAQTSEAKRNTIVSIQPLGIVVPAYQAEVEQVLGPTTTLGLAGSLWSDEGDSLQRLSGDVKIRYYPRGRAPGGFSVALSGGLVRITRDREAGENFSDVGYGMGLFADYAWLFAPARRYYAAVGAGLKVLRVEMPPAPFETMFRRDRYLTVRFSVGVAF